MSSNGRIKTSYSFHNQPTLIRGGHGYFSALEAMIEQAKKSIQIQIYIFEEDETGTNIVEKLISARKRNIEVQILLDGYASRKLSTSFKDKLREEGIKLRFFNPIFKSERFYFGRRLHHKIVVCDGTIALVGGINISNRYNDLPGNPAWLDWAIQIRGDAAYELHKLCNHFYSKWNNDTIDLDRKEVLENIDLSLHCAVRIRRNDWVMNKNQISASYMEMLKNAQHEIIIMSSYFIPSSFIRMSMVQAINRGVKIKLILAAISDIGIAKYTERYLYAWALRQGIEIFEYKKNVLHGKIAVCDERIVTIGSYNINDISALASIELNVDVEEQQFANTVTSVLKEIIQRDCNKINPKTFNTSQPIFEKLLQWISYRTFRLVFRLFTFYFTKQRK
jgi:cardiolipin synthase A/B